MGAEWRGIGRWKRLGSCGEGLRAIGRVNGNRKG